LRSAAGLITILSMQAVVIEEFGPPSVLQLREVADPECAPGEVLIEIAFASVTFVETQIRAGRAPHPSMLPALPFIPGNGVAGIVVAAGSGVATGVIGARVVSTTGGTGGDAQFVAVAAPDLILIPDGVEFADAAALLADGRTALALMDLAAIEPGATVLVEAAAGGVGSLLVQLARHAGARVVAAAGGAEKLQLARSLGAAVVVDYRRDGWVDEVGAALDGAAVDVVFDGVGGTIGRDAATLIGSGGRLCTFGMASGSFAVVDAEELSTRCIGVIRGSGVSREQMADLTARALRAAADGVLRPVIGQRAALAHASDAHQAIEDRAVLGKTLLVP
jgi:NADPH:quinone reductase